MKLQLLTTVGLLDVPQVTAIAEYWFGSCAGELEAGPVGIPSTDKISGCFRSETNDIDCGKVTNAPCTEGKTPCDNGYSSFKSRTTGQDLTIVDCDTFGQKPYDGSEPEPDGTRFATLVFTDTGVAAGTCSLQAYSGATKTCATFGSEVCRIGFVCQEFNG